ncbi:hypothetical protein [Caulobacter sp. 17J65-9]|uniref:hypothetical protein n=1 Tax=Caulobacter sp. 17J65-9 TaxID=2709382 RepID=UPI0013C8DBC0|nr:hypothetical protein [Caulobacter sp. 17J65-9]NEX91671.1 hypothetical protein [Caulobacter sp. 17J65-9]
MKTAEAKFSFPVLGFTPDRDIWGFQDLDALTTCGPLTLKKDMQLGMELIDSDGRRWVVRSVRRTGRKGRFPSWLLWTVLTAAPQSRIEHDLDELTPVSLAEALERACAAIEASPDIYGPEGEDEETIETRVAKVRAAKSVAGVFDLIGLDTFEAY